MSTWLDYWHQPEGLFAGSPHVAAIAERFVRDLPKQVPFQPGQVLLDYGCGEALTAGPLADAGLRVMLYDRSRYFDNLVRERLGDTPRVDILDEAGLAALPDGSVDVVVTNSVLQYLSAEELTAVAIFAARILKPDGVWVLADVVPPRSGLWQDVTELIADAFRGGFLIDRVSSMVRLAVSRYRTVRDEIGLSHYGDDDLKTALAPAGLALIRAPENLGWSARRRTYMARLTDAE